MNIVYSISTDDFQPVSYGDSYLYDNYGRLLKFLSRRIDPDRISRLGKPLLVDSKRIDWYADLSGPMKPLGEFSNEHQLAVEGKYVELLKRINAIVSEFASSGEKDKEDWAKLLQAIFKTEDNKLVSNGKEWVLVWGWKFRNKLAFVNPDFQTHADEPEVVPEVVEEEVIPIVEEPEMPIAPIPVPTPVVAEKEVEEKEVKIVYVAAPQTIRRLTFWERIKRFLRWIAYRFWALMLLIALILMFICLCKSCNKDVSNCEQYDRMDRELRKVEDRINDRCAPGVGAVNPNDTLKPQ